MRTAVALVQIVVGLGVVLYGLGLALMPLLGLYTGALNDPMADQAPAEDVQAAMIRGALIGAVGLIPLTIGSVMLKIMLFRKLRRRQAR